MQAGAKGHATLGGIPDDVNRDVFVSMGVASAAEAASRCFVFEYFYFWQKWRSRGNRVAAESCGCEAVQHSPMDSTASVKNGAEKNGLLLQGLG
jgi:hypothetical protein